MVILKKNWSQSELRLNFGRLRNDENLDFSFVKFSNSRFLWPTPEIGLALKSTFLMVRGWNFAWCLYLYVCKGWYNQIPKFQSIGGISRGGCITPPPRSLCKFQRASPNRVKQIIGLFIICNLLSNHIWSFFVRHLFLCTRFILEKKFTLDTIREVRMISS